MAVLVGHRSISGGVYWQITQPDDPGVLTVVFPERVATDTAVPASRGRAGSLDS
jgi:hypothetical protein